MSDHCQSYRPEQGTCADGFVQRPYCRDGASICHQCGAVSDRHLPYCLADSVPAHMCGPNGEPRFYRPQEAGSDENA